MSDLERLLARLVPGEPIGIVLPDGAEGVVTADRLALVRKGRGAGAIVRTIDGEEFPAAQGFAVLSRRLASSETWFKPHSDHLVNLGHLKRVRKASSGRYDLLLTGEATAPLTPTYSPGLRSRLSLPNLDHVVPFDRVAYWILKERLREFAKPIHLMTRSELVAAFGSTGPAEVIASSLIANFLWQFANRIRAGLQAPLEGGNVRSLWYIVKPALSRVNALGGMDHYKTLSEKLADFVSKGMMRYREFGLAEEEAWSIGDRRPEVIVAAEKRAHYRFLQRIQAEHGVSIIALAGKPKQITSEYFTDAFKAKVPGYWKRDRVRVIALIDYDPSGWIIGRTFLDDLRVFGIKHAKLIELVTPANFTPEELEAYKYSLLKPDPGSGDGEGLDAGDATTLKRWMKKFGGVNGEPYGLETDALMIAPDKVKALIRQTLGRRSRQLNKEEFKTRFPLVHAFMRSGKVNLDHSFLGDKFHRSPECKFWPHLERFFEMAPELECIDETIRRLTIQSPMDDKIKLSWEKKRLFRSAQSEISACFVFDRIFNIKVLRFIEETPSRKRPDFIVQIDHEEHPVEVKSHTGNINNNVAADELKCHARSYKGHAFDPKDASDLIRWLVDDTSVSSRDGKPMIPMFIEAENKEAHILFVHFEITPFDDPTSIISRLDGRTAAVDTFRSGNLLVRHGRWERLEQLKHLSEIVLWNECAADEFFLFTNGRGSLLKHLRRI